MAFRGDHLVLIELLWSDRVVFTQLSKTRSEVIENLSWKAASSYKKVISGNDCIPFVDRSIDWKRNTGFREKLEFREERAPNI